MMTREELDQALELLYEPDFDDLGRNTTPVRYPLDVIGAAARKQLALMAEKCGTCGGEGSPIVGYPCKDCHGSGKCYPQETVEKIVGIIAEIGQLDEKAIMILDALGETE